MPEVLWVDVCGAAGEDGGGGRKVVVVVVVDEDAGGAVSPHSDDPLTPFPQCHHLH